MADTLKTAWAGTVNDLFKAIGDWLPPEYMLQVDTEPFSDGASTLRLVMSCPQESLSVTSRLSREAMVTVAGDPKAVIWEAVRNMKTQLDQARLRTVPSWAPQTTGVAAATRTPSPQWWRESIIERDRDDWDRARQARSEAWERMQDDRPAPRKSEAKPEPPPRRKIRVAEIA